MTEHSPHGADAPTYRFSTEQVGTVAINDLAQRDLLALIGPGGFSYRKRMLIDGELSYDEVYVVEGIESVDVSSDVPDGSIMIRIGNEDAAQAVVSWVAKRLDSVREERAASFERMRRSR